MVRIALRDVSLERKPIAAREVTYFDGYAPDETWKDWLAAHPMGASDPNVRLGVLGSSGKFCL